MVSSSLAVAGICGTLFATYCVYFDHKRRSAPDYKKKLHERRNPKGPVKFPNVNNEVACYNFFMVEAAKGLKCFEDGNIDEGCNTIANSLVVFKVEKRTQYLSMVKKLKEDFYDAIVERIPEAEDRLDKYQNRFINIRLPCTTDATAIHKFIRNQIEMANKCMEDFDVESLIQHYAHVVVFIEEEELPELLAQLRAAFGEDLLKYIMKAAIPVEQRKKTKLLEEDQKLSLKCLLTISLAYCCNHFLIRKV